MAKWLRQRFAKPLFPGSNPGGASNFIIMLKKAILTEKTALTYDVIELTFKTEEGFAYKAGQFITIKINDKVPPCFRAYSIASKPASDNTFKLCIKVVPEGRGSNWLNNLEINNEIEFLGPSGNFVFSSKPDQEVLFIATGTGVAPFLAMIEDEISKGNKQKMHLLFGVRHNKDIFYEEEFKKLAAENENFRFDLTLSQPEDPNWQGHTGRVTNFLEQHIEHKEKTRVYICGLKDMIEAVTNLLKAKGFTDEQIHFEKYD